MRWNIVFVTALGLVACGEGESSGPVPIGGENPPDSGDSVGTSDDSSDETANDPGDNSNNGSGGGEDENGGGEAQDDPSEGPLPPVPSCQFIVDYEANDSDFLVIEAEDLPLASASGSGRWRQQSDGDISYIEWNGDQQFSNPGVATIPVQLGIRTPGRYRLLWYTRIGLGTDTREHNDNWVRFSGMAETLADEPAFYYGALETDTAGVETRRYARPYCNNDEFLATVEADPSVENARCVEGGGNRNADWLKVYSSGASDWRWDGATNDGVNGERAHLVVVEFPSAGAYTMEISARSSFNQVDRIVLFPEGSSGCERRSPRERDNCAPLDFSIETTSCR